MSIANTHFAKCVVCRLKVASHKMQCFVYTKCLSSLLKEKKKLDPWVRKIKPEKIENFVDELETELRKFSPLGFSELIKCTGMTNVTNRIFPKIRLSRRQFEFAKSPGQRC